MPPFLYVWIFALFLYPVRLWSAKSLRFTDILFQEHEVKASEVTKIDKYLNHVLLLSEPFKLMNSVFLRIEDNPRMVQWTLGELTITKEKKSSIPKLEQSLSPEMILNLNALGQALFDSEILRSQAGVSHSFDSYLDVLRSKRALNFAKIEENRIAFLYAHSSPSSSETESLLLDYKIASADRELKQQRWDKLIRRTHVADNFDFADHVVMLFRKLFGELYAASFAEHGQALINLNTLDLSKQQRKGLVDLEENFFKANRFFILTNSDLFFRHTRARLWQEQLRNRSLRDRIYFLHDLAHKMLEEIEGIMALWDFHSAHLNFKRVPFPNFYLLFHLKVNPQSIEERLSAAKTKACSSSLIPNEID